MASLIHHLWLFSYGRVGLHTKLELEEMVDRMESSQLHTINFTDNELVKDHLRHLVMFQVFRYHVNLILRAKL